MTVISFELKFPDLAAILKKERANLDLFIAAQMQFNRGMLFDQEGAYNGHKKWADLKFRQGQILSHRGTLRKSIAPTSGSGKAGPGGIVKFGSGVVTIGSSLIYAALMNWGTTKMPGGVMVPKNAKALMIPLPSGKSATAGAKELKKGSTKISRDVGGKTKNMNVIFRKSVKIPARRYDEWTTQDQQELSVAVKNKIVEILNR